MIYSYTLATLPEQYRDPDNWPKYDHSGMPQDKQERYLRLRKGIEAYLRGSSRKEAAKIAECSDTELGRLFERCVTVTEEIPFVGWQGLAYDFRIRPWTLKSLAERGRDLLGYVGRFIELLAEATMRQTLDRLIEGSSPTWMNGITQIQLREIFDEFLKACMARPDGKNRYPCDSDTNKSECDHPIRWADDHV